MRKYESKINQIEADKTYICHPTELEHDGVYWYLFYRRKWSSNWLEVWLVSEDKVAHKANYSLSWNGKELAGKDAGTLESYRETLYDWVIGELPDPKTVTPTIGTARTFEANINPDRWSLVDSIGKFDGVEWSLGAKDTNTPKAVWKNYVLYTQEKVAHKATYYLSWNGERLSKHRDVDNLSAHRPDLYTAVLNKLQEIK
jgi:hypothetical protein